MAEFWPDANKTVRVTIVTVDPRTRQVHAVLKDGVPISLAVWETPPFFRWPRENEDWTAIYESGFWRLGWCIGENDAIITDLLPGEARIDADKLYINGATFVQGQTVVLANDVRLVNPRAPTGPAGGVLSGTYPNPSFAVDMATQAELLDVEQDLSDHASLTTAAHGGIVASTDIRLTNSRTPTGPAGGVLSGTYPNPGFAEDMATQVELTAHTGLTTTAHGGIVASTDPRLTDSRAPSGPAGGILSGTYPNPGFAQDMATQSELDALNGTLVAHAALTTTAHGGIVASTDPRLTNDRIPTGPAGGVLSGTYPNPGFAVDMATQGELDTHAGLTTSAHGGVVASTDPRLTNDRIPTGPAGGVLSGTYPNPGFAVDMATQGELDAHTALTTTAHGGVVASTDTRLTDSRTPTGAAGGELAGTYPDPTLSGTLAAGRVFTWGGDTNLYRYAANILRTDDQFDSVGNIHAAVTSALSVGMGAVNGGTHSGILFGGDAMIYRLSANVLEMGGQWNVNGNIYAGVNAAQLVGIGNISGVPGVLFGSAGDTAIYRSGVGTLSTYNLTTTGTMTAAGTLVVTGTTSTSILTASTSITSPTLLAHSGGAGIGSVGLATGGSSNAGYLSWTTPNGTRQGYMGFNTNNTGVNLTIEQGSFSVTGDQGITGNLGVSGYVAIGSFYAPAANEAVRLIRGTIQSNNVILRGTGFTVTHTATGVYTVTFSTALGDIPSVIVTPGFFGHTAAVTAATTSTFRVEMGLDQGLGSGPVPTDCDFHFIATGPR